MTEPASVSSSQNTSLSSERCTNIWQSSAAVIETEQSPPMISVSLACKVTFTLRMRLLASFRPFLCPAEVSTSHTTLSVRLVQLLGPSLADLLSVDHFCNGHASFCPARVADLLRHWIVPCLLLA